MVKIIAPNLKIKGFIEDLPEIPSSGEILDINGKTYKITHEKIWGKYAFIGRKFLGSLIKAATLGFIFFNKDNWLYKICQSLFNRVKEIKVDEIIHLNSPDSFIDENIIVHVEAKSRISIHNPVMPTVIQPLMQKQVKFYKGLLDKECDEVLVFNIMQFADEEQDVLPIIEKCRLLYAEEWEDYDKSKFIARAGVMLLEQSLKIEFRESGENAEKIILEFMRRLICRSYHGTRTNLAKMILQNGITFKRKDSGFDHEEFKTLFKECNLDPSYWPFALRDENRFYVDYTGHSAIDIYSRNNCPEYFVRFKVWGSDKEENLDTLQLHNRLIKEIPLIKNIERVIQFVEKHWKTFASKKKNVAVLIVEQHEADPGLYHNKYYMGNLMDVYLSDNASDSANFLRNLYETFGYEIFTRNPDYYIERLADTFRFIHEIQGNNTSLTNDNTLTAPRIIHAVKIPATPLHLQILLAALPEEKKFSNLKKNLS